MAEERCSQSYFPPDTAPEEVREYYKNWAVNYDEDLNPETNWPGVINVVKAFVKTVGEANKDLRIVDLGAGTGLVAVELEKYGFTNIDALDATQNMLDKAIEKKLYKQYICEIVTGEKPLDIPTGSYDALITCGTITGGYVSANAFDEILRLVKQGGFICFAIQKNVYDDNLCGYQEKFEELAKSGKWQEISKENSDFCLIGLDIQKQCYIVCFKVLKNE